MGSLLIVALQNLFFSGIKKDSLHQYRHLKEHHKRVKDTSMTAFLDFNKNQSLKDLDILNS